MVSNRRDRDSEEVANALTRAIGAIDVVKGAVPIQIGQAILGTTSAILTIIRDTVKNKEDFRDLIEHCDWIRGLIQRSNWEVSQGGMSEVLSEALTELRDAIERTHGQISQREQRKLYRRLFSSYVDKEQIKNWTTSLERSLKRYELRLSTAMAESLRKLEQGAAGGMVSQAPLSASLPPPPPAVFCGRDDLVKEVCDILLSVQHPETRHVALLGPGGIGKSSLAKAILNQPAIEAKFTDRRFFVRFDDILASQITYSTFTERVARTLGIATAGHYGISDYVRTNDTLLVLDNAETFLDPHTSHDATRIKNALDEFGEFPSVSILITSRSRDLPRGLLCTLFDVPNLDARSAYDTFVKIYPIDVSRSTLNALLAAVGYHPLTIGLLAHAAKVNRWSIDDLNREWSSRRAQLLSPGEGKQEGLAGSIEVSLRSPRIRAFGEDVIRLLRMVAFLPQGVLRDDLQRIFASFPQAYEMVTVLHQQSLLMTNSGFTTMLAPIRIYLNDTSPGPDQYLLETARHHFYGLLNSPDRSQVERLIFLQDVNLESLIAFDLRLFNDSERLNAAIDTCTTFIAHLRSFKSRPTSLRPIVNRLDGFRIPGTNDAKMRCLHELSNLAYEQSNYVDTLELYTVLRHLSETAGQTENAIGYHLGMANIYRLLGRYNAAQKHLDHAQRGMQAVTTSNYNRGLSLGVSADVKQTTDAQISGAALGALCFEASSWFEAAQSFVGRWVNHAEGAFSLALIDNNTRAARTALDDGLALQRRSSGPGSPTINRFLQHLSNVAFMEGSIEEAKQYLNIARGNYLREKSIAAASLLLLDLTVVMIAEGDHEGARALVKQASDDLRAQRIVSDRNRWMTLYITGMVDLASGHVSEAYRRFEETKQYCEAQQEFHMRAFSTRAMGEIKRLEGDHATARIHFQETLSICHGAGIVPTLLYRRSDLVFFSGTPPATYEGWTDFLNGY